MMSETNQNLRTLDPLLKVKAIAQQFKIMNANWVISKFKFFYVILQIK